MLAGTRILVLEDEAIIAFALEDQLAERGATVTLAACLEQAECALEADTFDLAILDVNLNGTKSYPVAGTLQRLGVPFLFATGYGMAEHPAELAHAPTITKPYSLVDIERVLAATACSGKADRESRAG